MEIKNASNKVVKLQNKYSNKLKIIEVNSELSPNQKVVLLNKLLKELDRVEKRILFNCDIVEKTTTFSQGLSKGSVPNLLSGVLGVLGVVAGISAIATSPDQFNAFAVNAVGGFSVGLGVGMLINTALNSEILGVKTDKIQNNALNNFDEQTKAIKEIRKLIKQEISVNQALVAENGVGV